MLATDQFILEHPKDNVPLSKWQKTINLMAKLFSAPASFIVQYTSQGYQVIIANQQQENPYPAGTIIPSATNIFCKKVVEESQPLYVKRATELAEWQTNPEVAKDGFNSYLGMPIYWPSGEPFGTICVMDFEKTNYDDNYVELVEQFRSLVEDDLAILDNFSKMQQIAMLDPLTDIHNRRAFMMLAEQRISLAKRLDLTLGLLFIDADNFKQLNDEFGHDVGDKVLQSIADSIKANLRDSDIVGRIGGDEFVAIVQVKQASDLQTISDKIAQQHAKSNLGNGLPPNTVSIGCALAKAEQALPELISRADQAMYKQKALKKLS
ncbi:sensor domain-containing diguanylate cyclase [Endozoicomonas sp. G2_1]|uniref:sensor domain-containing diguanylate cyclase n=1 Tax=Endozoicomonas sp. G2_1 TaxID=2821091 RepID=UPI001ADBA05E|nr:sensor domain-containing diguanylate cyclase [Endozoicomonas sp. G2_1]MBO9489498.1 sensor domain-containing diguanylate cyclase [Endozoicomonas sp. G2_1]